MKVAQTLSLLYTLFVLGRGAPLVESIGQEVLGGVPDDLIEPEPQALEVAKPAIEDAEKLDDISVRPFFYRSWYGSEMITKELLRNGADVDSRDHLGRTALHQAVVANHRSDVVELLKSGADISARDNNGRTALHLAAAVKGLEVLKVLLEEGADVNVRDNDGKTPLQMAAMDGFEWRFQPWT